MSDLLALATSLGCPVVDLETLCARLSVTRLVPQAIAEGRGVAPLHVAAGRLHVAMAGPGDPATLAELEFLAGVDVVPYAAPAGDLRRWTRAAYAAAAAGEAFLAGPRTTPTLRAIAESPDGDDGPLPFVVVHPPRAEEPDAATGVPTEAWEREPSVVTDPVAGPTAEGSVLVVEDDAAIRALLVRTLRHDGHHVIEADSGVEAVRMLRRHKVSLLVIDVMLPGLNGFEVVRRLREGEASPDVRVIMVSAIFRGEAYAREAGRRLGVHAYLEKPFRVSDVIAAATSALASPPVKGHRDTEETTRKAEAALSQGLAAWRRGSLSEAANAFRCGLRADPLAFRLRCSLGLVYLEMGHVHDAICQLERATAQRDGDHQTLDGLARAYLRAGYLQKAREMAERALAASADRTDAARGGRLVESLHPGTPARAAKGR